MTTLRKFGAISAEFAAVADFLIVYIEEAHPAETKHFKNNVEIREHRCIGERVNAASQLVSNEAKYLQHTKVVVDSMDNEGLKNYAAMPERLFIVHEDKVALVGGLGPFEHMKSINRAEDWLKNYVDEYSSKHQV